MWRFYCTTVLDAALLPGAKDSEFNWPYGAVKKRRGEQIGVEAAEEELLFVCVRAPDRPTDKKK